MQLFSSYMYIVILRTSKYINYTTPRCSLFSYTSVYAHESKAYAIDVCLTF